MERAQTCGLVGTKCGQTLLKIAKNKNFPHTELTSTQTNSRTHTSMAQWEKAGGNIPPLEGVLYHHSSQVVKPSLSPNGSAPQEGILKPPDM